MGHKGIKAEVCMDLYLCYFDHKGTYNRPTCIVSCSLAEGGPNDGSNEC